MIAIVFDTETTALIPNSALPLEKMPHMIEVYCWKGLFNGSGSWEQLDEIELLVKPPFPIDDEVIKITGITNEMVKDQPPIGAVWDKVISFFKGADIVVAHNLSYDMQIFDNESQRLGHISFPAWPKEKICTVEATEHLTGKRMKLIDLHTHLFNKGFEEAHRARNDVMATVRCFTKLWELGEI